jgi:hypothetical protein
MNWFQIASLPLAGFLFLRAASRYARGGRGRMPAFFSALLWLAAAAAIANPDLTTIAAGMLGIGRGADLLLYILALLFAGSVFYFYNRLYRVECSLTDIVRDMAIRDGLSRWPAPREKQEA